MVEFSPKVEKAVMHQNHVREEWGEHDTKEGLEQYWWNEEEEYRKAIEECELGADPFILASEAGDTGYLYIRLMEYGKVDENITQRMEEIVEQCTDIGLDINLSIYYKVLRNDAKYINTIMNNGFGYSLAVYLSKNFYKQLGGEDAFNYAFMMMGEDLSA